MGARYVKCGVMIHITVGGAVASRHTRDHSQQGGGRYFSDDFATDPMIVSLLEKKTGKKVF